MDPSVTANFERLKLEQEKCLQFSDDKIAQWNKFKEDYLVLRTRLETLPHELKYEVMVPISKMAFMPGRLVNTNEILVLLGDNWFVEKSAKQACELIDRRLKSIEEFLGNLNNENRIFKDQLNWTKNLLEEKNEYVNIEERLETIDEDIKKAALSEEQKRELRKRQQEKAAQFQAKINEEIKINSKSFRQTIDDDNEKEDEEEIEEKEEVDRPKKNIDASFMEKFAQDLEKLDLEPKFNDNEPIDVDVAANSNFDKLIQEYDKTIDRENNERMGKRLHDIVIGNNKGSDGKKRVKWSDKSNEKEIQLMEEDTDENYSDSDDYDEEETAEDATTTMTKNSVEPIRIEITHTKSEKLAEIERNLAVSRDKADINSPSDIYAHFYKPKSILKPSGSGCEVGIGKDILTSEVPKVATKSDESTIKFEPHKAFSGEIVERRVGNVQESASSTEEAITDTNMSKKPISKFKLAKMNK